VQRLRIILQNLALLAIATTPTAPAAGLGSAGGCTALAFAQKRDAKPVGGRGISAFSTDFFFVAGLSKGRTVAESQTRVSVSPG
jgi:hypothetical protein